MDATFKTTKKANSKQKPKTRVYLMPAMFSGKSKHFKNRIKEHLEQRGYAEMRLSTETYNKIGCTDRQFARWIDNTEQPRIDQLAALSIIISEPVQNLYTYAH